MRDGLKLLLVEDQEIARLGLRLVLEKEADFAVIGEATDGPSAVAQSLELAPDVVLMDIGLPGFDGIEATKRIKVDRSEVKVIVITLRDNMDAVFGALSAGADAYLLKESSIDLITTCVRTVAKGAVFLDSRIAAMLLETQTVARTDPQALPRDNQFGLSPRELEVLELVVQGFSNPEMAGRLFISNETVKTHMRHIMEKLMVADRTQAAIKALRAGLFGAMQRREELS